MKCYLNWKGPQGTETIDEIDSADFKHMRDFVAESGRLLGEYGLAGMPGHWSQRPCKNWK